MEKIDDVKNCTSFINYESFYNYVKSVPRFNNYKKDGCMKVEAAISFIGNKRQKFSLVKVPHLQGVNEYNLEHYNKSILNNKGFLLFY